MFLVSEAGIQLGQKAVYLHHRLKFSLAFSNLSWLQCMAYAKDYFCQNIFRDQEKYESVPS